MIYQQGHEEKVKVKKIIKHFELKQAINHVSSIFSTNKSLK